MKQGWRWYGERDAISLKEIRQAGVTDVVAALYGRKPGEVWPVAEIRALAAKVKAAGMVWSVVESVPVHEDIKRHSGDWEKYIENYKKTLINLAKCGIKTVCYNFMPVLDWTRSDLAYELPDGSTCLGYNEYEVAAFDMFALKRKGAEADYDAKTKARAKKLWAAYKPAERKRVEKSILTGLPGTVDDLTPKQFLAALATYKGIGDKELRKNMYDFLNAISPVLDKYGIDMCIHPDDPPHPIFGLPRILSSAADIREMVKKCPSKHVGLTLCTGSLGGSLENDEVAIFKEFAKRIFFCHFRNLEYEEPGVFHESHCHLTGKTDLPALMIELLKEEKRRGEGIVVRPDHGRLMEIDKGRKCYCGYSYGGRLVGLAELRGLEIALKYVYPKLAGGK
jgi:mannonate dehydratase